METQTFEEVLEHYGVLGMRWGVRRSDKELAKARTRRKAQGKPVTPVSEDAKKAKKAAETAKKQGVDALSNDELKELNERLNLESNYERLTSSDSPQEVSRGKTVAKTLLKELGNISGNVARSEAQRILAKQVRKQILGG